MYVLGTSGPVKIQRMALSDVYFIKEVFVMFTTDALINTWAIRTSFGFFSKCTYFQIRSV